jgi:hypothetical protein
LPGAARTAVWKRSRLSARGEHLLKLTSIVMCQGETVGKMREREGGRRLRGRRGVIFLRGRGSGWRGGTALRAGDVVCVMLFGHQSPHTCTHSSRPSPRTHPSRPSPPLPCTDSRLPPPFLSAPDGRSTFAIRALQARSPGVAGPDARPTHGCDIFRVFRLFSLIYDGFLCFR